MLKRKTLRKEFIWRSILSGGRFISPTPPWEVVTVSGDIVTISDAVSGENLVGCTVTVPYTSGGVSAVEVTRCGKNVMNVYAYSADALQTPSSPPKQTNIYGTTINSTSPQAGVLDVTQIPNSSYGPVSYRNGYITIGFFAPWQKDAQLLFQCYFNTKSNPLSVTNRTAYVNGNASLPSFRLSLNDIASNQINLKNPGTSQSSRYLEIRCGGSSFEFSQPMITVGSTATDYEPYTGDTYTITPPAGFYGGTVDLTYGTITSLYDSTGALLPEPVVSSITPVEISTLTGVNNIWADAGNVEVKYYREGANT